MKGLEQATGTNSQLPLTEPVFLILLSLAGGQKHGYAILKDVEELSQGAILLSTSTLYGALGRLEEQELIVRVSEATDEPAGPGLPRKFYQLTSKGRRLLQAETSRLQQLAHLARLRLDEFGLDQGGR